MKTAIVTGASTGLGLAITKLLLQENYTVFGISKSQTNWATAESKIGDSKQFTLHQADLSDEGSVREVIETIFEQAGTVNLLINNAGYIDGFTPFKDASLAEFENNLNSNLVSVFLTTKYFLQGINKDEKNSIINVSSMAGKRGVSQLSGYSASKFGVLALSQCVAKEYENDPLSCVTICPGGINTAMRAKLFDYDDASKQQTPEFVAGIILEVILNKVEVESGGDVVIRHGKTTVNPCPTA